MAGETKAYQKNIDRGPVIEDMRHVDLTSPLSRGNPLAGQRYFDKDASDLAETIAGRTPDYFEKKITHGLMEPEVPDAQVDRADVMASAIAGRYENAYKDTLRGITSETRANAPVMTSESSTRGSAMAGAIRQNEIGNYEQQAAFQAERENMLAQWKSAKNAAKAGLMGAIFSGIGAVGGAIIGGPAGAAAGAAAGGAVAGA